MVLVLREATREDVPRFAKIIREAFEGEPWTLCMYPNGQDAETIAASEKRWGNDFDDSRNKYVLVEDTELNPSENDFPMTTDAKGHAVAVAKYVVFDKPRPKEEWDVPAQVPPFGATANQAAADHFISTLHDSRRRHNQGEPYILLWYLDTDAKHRRRGAGSMLLEWGNALADRLGLHMYVESSPMGHSLYAKHGYEDREQIDVDCRPFGQDVTTTNYVMIRPAKKA